MSNHPELRKFDSIRAPYEALFRSFDEDDMFVRGDFAKQIIPDKWADDGLEPTVMPTAVDAVDNATDHILTDPKISVPMRPVNKDREAERQIADNKRAFLQSWWRTVAVEQGDPLRRGKRSLIMGKMVLKKSIDWSLIPPLKPDATPPEKRAWKRKLERIGRSKFIWKLEFVPKNTIYEDPVTPHDPRWTFEKYKIRVEDAVEMYGDASMENGRTLSDIYNEGDANTELEYLEYWTKPRGKDTGKYCVFIEGTKVHESVNPYHWETPISEPDDPDYDGYIPYFIEDPGWGEITSDFDPSRRYVSIIKPLHSLLRAETRQITEVEAWLRLYMWKPVIGTNLPEQEDGEAPFTLGPGAFWNIDAESGQNIDVLQFGEAPATVFQFLGKVQNAADRSTKFGALGGQPQRGVTTATESDQLIRNAATKLNGPLEALRRVVIKISRTVLQDIDKVLEAPVTLYGSTETGPSEVTLKPSDINGFYGVDAQLETSDEAMLNARNARLWADLYRIFPGLSERTAMGKAGIENPTDEQDERFIEDLSRMEPMMQVAALLALTGIGQQAEVVRQAFEQQIASGGQPPAQGGAGDAGFMTNVDEMGNPVEAGRTEARDQFVQQAQPEAFFR